MYKLSSTNKWYHGARFDSFAAAKAEADKAAARGVTADVIALTDRENFRVAYTPSSAPGGKAIPATYSKQEKH